jgi:ABC-type antimicrobial peptide transport system permease subunit
MGIPMLGGRGFGPPDHELSAKLMRQVAEIKSDDEIRKVAESYTLPAVINQTMAKTFWPKEDALGKVFRSFATFQIVGIVGDVRQQSLRSAAMPEAYFPLEWGLYSPNVPTHVVARGEGQPESMTGGLRSAVESLDSSLALMTVRSMPEIISESMTDTRYEAWLLGAMAGLALILAAVGTFGVMSYVVGQRTNEIGIRMTLGAQRAQIVAMVLQQAGAIVVVGIVLGLAGAAGGARLIETLLVGVKPFDLATYVSVAALLVLVSLAACYLPVRRAMSVDPMVALRDE